MHYFNFTIANRVLFAEAGKEVVDFLFDLLALQLGSIVKLLSEDHMLGSIGSLYNSLENLDSTYIQANQDKDVLLSPQDQEQRQHQNNFKFVTRVEAPSPPKYVTKVCGIQCPSCSGRIQRVLQYVDPESRMVDCIITTFTSK